MRSIPLAAGLLSLLLAGCGSPAGPGGALGDEPPAQPKAASIEVTVLDQAWEAGPEPSGAMTVKVDQELTGLRLAFAPDQAAFRELRISLGSGCQDEAVGGGSGVTIVTSAQFTQECGSLEAGDQEFSWEIEGVFRGRLTATGWT